MMRSGIIVVAVVVLLAVVAAIAAVTVVRHSFPDYSTDVSSPELDRDVTVRRGDLGIPQIYASTSHDLFYAQGYVHAQDRFFEMDYRRHVTAGRLSELVGENPEALSADKVIRTLGWRRVAAKELPLLDKSTRKYLKAYADGVNSYISDKSPSDLGLSYTVLGTRVHVDKVAKWTPVDSLAWLKAMAWDLKTNFNDELERAQIYTSVPNADKVDELFPQAPNRHAPIVTADELNKTKLPDDPKHERSLKLDKDDAHQWAAALEGTSARDRHGKRHRTNGLEAASRALKTVPALLGRGDDVGSNSWVVAGEYTTTGKPLLANDPHLSLTVPGIWYQAGLHCRTIGERCPFDVAGFGFSGMPGVFIGHNRDIGWGFTNMGADVTDFYLEKIQGSSYLRDGKPVPLKHRTEHIKVAGSDTVTIDVRSTVHGPIVSDVLEDTRLKRSTRMNDEPIKNPHDRDFRKPDFAVSLAWTALTPGRTADSIFKLDAAENFSDVRHAARTFDVPAQNIVYADTAGHIGYQTPGRIPVRNKIVGGPAPSNGTWPVPGWDSDFDWQGYIDFEQLPSVLDPENGFIVTANQQVVGGDYPNYLGSDFDYGYRSQQIRDSLTEAIKDGRKLSSADMSSIQQSTYNEFAQTLVRYLLQIDTNDFTDEAVDLLKGWDYTEPADSGAAAYFNAVWADVLKYAFRGEIPKAAAPNGSDRWMGAVSELLKLPKSSWWDDKQTPNVVETRDEVLKHALVHARKELTVRLGKDPSKWQWGMLHRLELKQSPLGSKSVPGIIRWVFNADSYPVGGSTAVVDATGWSADSNDYTVTTGPSMRMVLDFDDLDRSTWVNLTGNSGHPFSPHYLDQLQAWVDGRTFAWPFTPDAVEQATEDVMTMRATASSGGER